METLVALSNDLAAAAERAAAAVWAVHARPRLPSSGVLWRDGLLVTANHTVRADEGITVTSPDGRSVDATLVGRDPSLDLALLKLDAAGAAAAHLGDSETVRMGHVVLALGAGPRVSWGVVSAVGAVRARQHERDLLSLDLTLYPGFSGGPLVDPRGQVVGVNTSGISRHLQVAVPANLVGRVVDDLLRHGRIPQAYLGVATQSVRLPEALRERLGLAQRTAVIVVEVQPGSPAADGLLIGDMLLALDGHAITDPFDLRAVLRRERIGARITAAIVRGGETRDVPLTIGERPPRRP